MDIQNAVILEDGSIQATINGIEMVVPDNSGNRHRREIAEWEAKGNTIAPFKKIISRGDVNAERDRRIAENFTFGATAFDLDPASKQRVAGAATLAGFAIGAGALAGDYLWAPGATAPFAWIGKDNSLSPMDAQTCFAFGQAAATHETKHIFAASNLKAMNPIPEDLENDKYWP